MNRPELVAYAQNSIARGSKSFALASRLFDRDTRERAWLLYAWCRRCDDIADGQEAGFLAADPAAMALVGDAAMARIDSIYDDTDAALEGRPVDDPAFAALGVVAAECDLPHATIHDVIEGFELDAAEWRPRTEADLLQYCYHVAGAVGRLMAIVMGVSPRDTETLDRATDLGLAFQLANIARDIADDDAGDRCYLPMEWLVEMDIPPGEHMKPWYRPKLAELAARLTRLSERYETSARVGAARLPFRARWAVLAAAGIYGDIARLVRTRGEHAWDHRTVTSRSAKLGWVARALVQAMRSAPQIDRDGLWSHPHRADPA